jgi:S1-C subfamily serine protease
MCFLKVVEVATTAKVVPGSSGGMVVDDVGDLIGVVSASNGDFGFLVRLQDIKNFLAKY